MIKLVARYADVWNPSGAARERPAEFGEKLAQACEAIGRDVNTIRRASLLRWSEDGFGKLLEDAGEAYNDGFTEHMIYLPEQVAPAAANAIAESLPELYALKA
jgi:alkanesulfonate monooxygenase SsuD/methylene tetrahydromethanopterin reductase-like flavin-dependent oxidoreductase (luciferase family)